MEMRMQAAFTAVKTAALGRLANEEAHIGVLEVKIASSDPKEVLKRGYSIITDAEGVKKVKAQGTKPGDAVSVMFPDGTLDCKVEKVIIL